MSLYSREVPRLPPAFLSCAEWPRHSELPRGLATSSLLASNLPPPPPPSRSFSSCHPLSTQPLSAPKLRTEIIGEKNRLHARVSGRILGFSCAGPFGWRLLSWLRNLRLPRSPPAPTASCAHHSFLDQRTPLPVNRSFVS